MYKACRHRVADAATIAEVVAEEGTDLPSMDSGGNPDVLGVGGASTTTIRKGASRFDDDDDDAAAAAGDGETTASRLSMVMEVKESEAGSLAVQAVTLQQLAAADEITKLPKKNKVLKVLKTVAVGTVMVLASTVALLIPLPDMSTNQPPGSAPPEF